MDRPPTLSARVEASPLGRVAIALLVLVVVLCEIGTNLPPSRVQREVSGPAAQVARILGVEQSWGVFAPNPRSTSIRMEAVVTFADGRQTTWTLPQGRRVVANLRFYRWRKWLERASSDRYRGTWRTTAQWIADQYDDVGTVVRVELVRWSRVNDLEGDPVPWDVHTFFTLDRSEAGP